LFAFTLIAGLLVLLVGMAMLVGAWIRHWTSEFAVTDRRVIIKVGLISRQTIEINMSKVESVEVRQGILARLLREPPGPSLPASWLQRHPRLRVMVDGAAASRLVGVRV
jgi:hypothetical protein